MTSSTFIELVTFTRKSRGYFLKPGYCNSLSEFQLPANQSITNYSHVFEFDGVNCHSIISLLISNLPLCSKSSTLNNTRLQATSTQATFNHIRSSHHSVNSKTQTYYVYEACPHCIVLVTGAHVQYSAQLQYSAHVQYSAHLQYSAHVQLHSPIQSAQNH